VKTSAQTRAEKPGIVVNLDESSKALKFDDLLALALLVARIGAQDAHDAAAADHLAVPAHLLDRRSDFHCCYL
jgi:hypothetical protein